MPPLTARLRTTTREGNSWLEEPSTFLKVNVEGFQSGRQDSNLRLLLPKSSALTRLSYVPALVCPDSVTVCTYKIALGDLLQYGLVAQPANHRAHILVLDRSWAVVPLHRRGMEYATTIGAWPSLLEAPGPRGAATLPQSLLLDPQLPGRRVVGRVVDLSAGLTPSLAAVSLVAMEPPKACRDGSENNVSRCQIRHRAGRRFGRIRGAVSRPPRFATRQRARTLTRTAALRAR